MKSKEELMLAGVREERERILHKFRVHQLVRDGRDYIVSALNTASEDIDIAVLMEAQEGLDRIESALWMLGDPGANPKALHHDPDAPAPDPTKERDDD